VLDAVFARSVTGVSVKSSSFPLQHASSLLETKRDLQPVPTGISAALTGMLFVNGIPTPTNTMFNQFGAGRQPC
jgi:hypothetical protein